MTEGRITDLRRFYSLLSALQESLGGPRRLATCTGQMSWSNRGVYFFMELGENRSDSGSGHELSASAPMRSTKAPERDSGRGCRGPTNTGAGNHRCSIFRLLVGTALMADRRYDCPTWGIGSHAPAEIRVTEQTLERQVSEVIRAMPFVWLAIGDEPGPHSLRGYIERNSIALLSNFGKKPLDSPSAEWLGKHCSRERVQKSGLWNSNHVHEQYDPAFLDLLEQLVARMVLAP